MTETRSPFEHSTPELYARYMEPLLFEPYAKVVAQRVSRCRYRRRVPVQVCAVLRARSRYWGVIFEILLPWMPSPAISPFCPNTKA